MSYNELTARVLEQSPPVTRKKPEAEANTEIGTTEVRIAQALCGNTQVLEQPSRKAASQTKGAPRDESETEKCEKRRL